MNFADLRQVFCTSGYTGGHAPKYFRYTTTKPTRFQGKKWTLSNVPALDPHLGSSNNHIGHQQRGENGDFGDRKIKFVVMTRGMTEKRSKRSQSLQIMGYIFVEPPKSRVWALMDLPQTAPK